MLKQLRKNIIIKFFFFCILLSTSAQCSKKDIEKNKIQKAQDISKNVGNNSDQLKLNSQQNVAKIQLNASDVLYKTPIFIEIPKNCLTKNGNDFTVEWKNFIKEYKPFGIILHKYHFKNKKQIKVLIDTIKELGGQDTIIATDREGGRVDRMFWGNHKEWRHYPSPEEMGTLYEQYIKISQLPADNPIKKAIEPNIKQLERDFEEIFDQMFLEMKQSGINMTFAPACDVKTEISDKFTIGARSYSNDQGTVVAISKIFAKSAIKNNILIAPKHAPGLGSVSQDTHFNVASVEKSKNQILISDMRPFVELFKSYKKNIHFVLCPHVLFKDIDSQNISTKSEKFSNFIRSNTKQDVLIISDDLSMTAFSDINAKNTIEKAISDTKSDIIITGIGKNLTDVKQIADLVKKKDNERFFKFLVKRGGASN